MVLLTRLGGCEGVKDADEARVKVLSFLGFVDWVLIPGQDHLELARHYGDEQIAQNPVRDS